MCELTFSFMCFLQDTSSLRNKRVPLADTLQLLRRVLQSASSALPGERTLPAQTLRIAADLLEFFSDSALALDLLPDSELF